ncbi:MAG: hypothetical protein C0475_04540 [Planctomyces sp.]|nr:hypothetical protein [Planctomyces sp.]MBA4120041.1 hypothetical protein [Isosphaera sp.]
MGSPASIALLILGAALLVPLVWLIATYNRFVSLRQHVRESWQNIDIELKRRYDLIPNLVATVKGYTDHEQGVLAMVTELRSKAVASTGSAQSQAADEASLQLGLRQLFAVAEGYPSLKADAHFRSLQQELANTEDRIAAARRYYNANVRDLNQLCRSFPSSLIAGMAGAEPATYFELSDQAERVVPRVSL